MARWLNIEKEGGRVKHTSKYWPSVRYHRNFGKIKVLVIEASHVEKKIPVVVGVGKLSQSYINAADCVPSVRLGCGLVGDLRHFCCFF